MVNMFKDLKTNFLTLVILLVVVCIIYLILKNLNTDNYQSSTSLVTSLEDQMEQVLMDIQFNQFKVKNI